MNQNLNMEQLKIHMRMIVNISQCKANQSKTAQSLKRNMMMTLDLMKVMKSNLVSVAQLTIFWKRSKNTTILVDTTHVPKELLEEVKANPVEANL